MIRLFACMGPRRLVHLHSRDPFESKLAVYMRPSMTRNVSFGGKGVVLTPPLLDVLRTVFLSIAVANYLQQADYVI